MKELPPNATETRKAFGELNVKLSTLEARVRQTAAAVAAALDMKKLEAQMSEIKKQVGAAHEKGAEFLKEIMQKVDDCKAAGAPVKEELVTEIDEAIAAVKGVSEAPTAAVEKEIEKCIKETGWTEGKAPGPKLRALRALQMKLVRAVGSLDEIRTSAVLSVETGKITELLTRAESAVHVAQSETRQAMEDADALMATFYEQEPEKKVATGNLVIDALTMAKTAVEETLESMDATKATVSSSSLESKFSVRVSVLTGQVKAEAERLKAEITKISDMLAAIEAEGRAKALEERTTAVRASFEAVLAEVKPLVDATVTAEEAKEQQEGAAEELEAVAKELPMSAARVAIDLRKVHGTTVGWASELTAVHRPASLRTSRRPRRRWRRGARW